MNVGTVSSSFSTEKSSKNPGESSSRPVGVHHLRELHQANRSRDLGIFDRERYTPCGLRVRKIGWYFENVRGEMIHSAQKTATAGNENAGAQIAEIRFLFETALEQLE